MHVYLHVPFCARRCSYCDFAIAVRREVPSAAYSDAVVREWSGWLRHGIWGRSTTIETLYFGGGTPSRLAPGAIARLVDRMARDRDLDPAAEITLEANPDDATPEAAQEWRRAGVNRISLGAQSFDPRVLRWMHRTHSAPQIGAAARTVRDAGIAELSLDLIFGLPAELGRDWEADLAQALELGPDHLSLYGLTIEDHTPLARWTARGEVAPVDEERYAAEYLTADVGLGRAGYEHYEVSNYALPGRRARHNSAYWRRAPFIGMGPSAHSAWANHRQWNLRDWAAYQHAVAAGKTTVAGTEVLDGAAVELEELYLGLRTREGYPGGRLPGGTARRWVDAGWATIAGDRVRLTPEGWLRLDALVAGVEGLGPRL